MEVRAMTQYKTIAGPVGLEVKRGEDYDGTVKKYAAIIDQNAVGGWELLWIQQIPVTKVTTNIFALLGVAAIGAAVGYAMGGWNNGVAFAAMGGLIGAGIGAAAFQNRAVEFFNMLVFAKKE
jgi:hypothetical protein